MGERSEPLGARPDTAVEDSPRFTTGYQQGAASQELVSRFNADGYIVIENALGAETIDRVRAAADTIVAEGGEPGRWWGKPETAPRRVEYRGIFNLDEAFMELLAPPHGVPARSQDPGREPPHDEQSARLSEA